MIALQSPPVTQPGAPDERGDILSLVNALFAARAEYRAATDAAHAHEHDSTHRQLLAWQSLRAIERALLAARRTPSDWRAVISAAHDARDANEYRAEHDPENAQTIRDASESAFRFCVNGYWQTGLYHYRE